MFDNLLTFYDRVPDQTCNIKSNSSLVIMVYDSKIIFSTAALV